MPSKQKGLAMVEMAILVSVLLLILWGITEFGRAFYTYNTLLKGTRDAARYLSVRAQNEEVINEATNLVVCGKIACAEGETLVPGLSAANVTIDPPDTLPGPPAVPFVTVRIRNYAFHPLWTPWIFGGGPENLGSWITFGTVDEGLSTTMRRGAS